ncbi:MAG: ABC transporter permease subunit [Deltaproteobacteria bacterium]
MNIFFRELKANRKSLIIWSICMFLLVLSGMAKYKAYSSAGAATALFLSMPRSIRILLGFGSFDVTTISGFFALLFLYIEFAAALHAALLGAGIIAKEERDKTTEYLMTKPVSRTTVITAKLIAALINIIVINVVSLVSSIFIVATYNQGTDISGKISIFFLSMFIVQLIFLSLGAFMAAFMRNPKSAGSFAVAVLLIGFVISKLTDFTETLNFLNLFSPFKYFNFYKLESGRGLDSSIVILSLVLVAIFFTSTYYFYQKRDLNV